MAAEVHKKGLVELLAYSNADFDTKIKEMSLKDLLDTIATLQKEMGKEQENFNSLSAERSSLKKNSQQYKQISKEMTESQTRLTALMDRSMKCFQQQGNQTTSTKFPNVQRRSSLKETSEKQHPTKPVQRNQSARISNFGGEITQAKSTPDLVKSSNQPVFLKSLTNVTTSKIEVKRTADQSNEKPSMVKPVHNYHNGGTIVADDNLKKPSVKSSATFNLQKSQSHEFLANNKPVNGTGVNKKFGDSEKQTTGFNVVLRKTNRSLIDNEEQENNFRHSVDLDLRKSSDIPLPNKVNNNFTKSTDTANTTRIISSTNTATKSKVISTGNETKMSSAQLKHVNGTVDTAKPSASGYHGDTPVNNINNESSHQDNGKQQQQPKQNTTTITVKTSEPKQQNGSTITVKTSEPKPQQNETTVTVKPSELNPKEKYAAKHVQHSEQKVAPATQNENYKDNKKKTSADVNVSDQQRVVKSSAPYKTVTAAEARAVATGGERQNLLQEIQNFKRKPVQDVVVENDVNDTKIVKSSIKPNTDVTNDLDLSPDGGNGVDGEEVAPHRINLINWDPTKLLKVLYTVKLNKDTTEDVSHQFVNMEGLMEKLPMNKKKATLLKTWKRRFFRAKDGWLHYYEGLSEDQQTPNRDKPSDSVQLMGGKIEDLGNRVLGVDDGRGRFLMVRCPTEKEYGQWKLALESQTVNNIKATYVRPALSSPQHPEKPVVIIDIGSGGIRAGIMGAQPCLPQMFFPSIVARNKNTKELVIGIDAFKPEVRKNSTLIKVVEPSNKVDKFAIDMELIAAVFDYIFKGLQVEPAKYWVMLSTPYKLGDIAMTNLMKILVNTYRTKGVCMVMQSLLSLYSYNTTSGIIVDIGERMEILPIFDGVLIEGGVSRQAYGGQKITDSLNSSLVGLKYKFYNPVDKLLVRYVMEQSCYVCDNYKDLKSKCDKDSESFQTTVYLNNFDLPDDAHMSVTHDLSCFESPEGFFNTDLWGMDYPVVHKLIYSAIQSCPMDNRKHMYRAIYLSGGVTMLAGFAERLEGELKKLAPPGVVVEVHASPQRYHSAFIGAGTLLSNVPINEQIFISAEEWTRDGAKAFRKWKGPS